ncbi:uncharacterized protein LOC130124156 isoform X2 [Lampris incognitus]|uniref:uncharacterized protein LOC130124156 isoform X1 n=1 Tax=Lampris incognitus TaxID=2546036 RepID=UPI0024B481BA|nr:uncharacterized protein LOC130124156 isoform X1 [Lampris incognitus]XP_056149572.1 uncharacterized protein LOC130124156 isoform X2 [Lampris incognitus]
MMRSYMSRMACGSDAEGSDLIMSRLSGKARDVVKVSLRSHPGVIPAELPTTIFDILKRNFSELTYSSMPMKDFYGTVPRVSESAMDYWIRLNKAIDIADESLRRRDNSVEDPSAGVVMMFITHCPDPRLAVYFQFKPVEQWTAAEVQERLDGHVRSLKSTAAHPQHANVSVCTHEWMVPAPHCGTQHQPVVVTSTGFVCTCHCIYSCSHSVSTTPCVGRSVSPDPTSPVRRLFQPARTHSRSVQFPLQRSPTDSPPDDGFQSQDELQQELI